MNMDDRAQVSFEYLAILAFLSLMAVLFLLMTPSVFSQKDGLKATNRLYADEAMKMLDK